MNAYYAQDRIEAQREFVHQSGIERDKWIDDRAKEVIAAFPKDPSSLVLFSIPVWSIPHEGLRHDSATEAYNDFVSAVAYAQAEYEWSHRTGCPF